ncbi:baseplate J/gp47 family protein [Shinella sp. CPCC 100929]|uniref:Baseplate J/gp47 family protein n=1 Tax=Shinella lacus TaxID=2654216 RepID=A0ABT1R6X2_9HYPH|nr:baseplate J/gp47 family protein [Shinella lacus]MCQ4630939.1 baseplate J/gp47 family protein [Shinella lacus]
MTTTLDISSLPAPQVVRTIDPEAEVAAFVAALKEALPQWRGVFEGDSFQKICQVWALRLIMKEQEHNEDARSILLAYAKGPALDHILTTYHRTPRLPGELDEDYRARGQLAPEAMADLGITHGGYIFRVRSAFKDAIKDVRPIRRDGGRIELRLLGRNETGAVSDAVLAAIIRAFQPEGATQSTDILTVLPAEIDERHVTVRLAIPRGPDPTPVRLAARTKLEAYAASVHRINAGLYVDALYAAAHVPPVITVSMTGLTENILRRPEVAIRLVIDDVIVEVMP